MTTPAERGGGLRILSDLHLGHSATLVTEVNLLTPLLEGVDTVVFNGDTCEQEASSWHNKGSQQQRELEALCARLGVTPRFLTGNHDPDLSKEAWVELNGGQIFVTHGEMLCLEVAPWSREYLRRQARVGQLIQGFGAPATTLQARSRQTRQIVETLRPTEEVGRKFKRRGHLWSALWPPMRAVNILRAWVEMFALAEQFVERYCPSCEVFLFGHFHRSGIREQGGRLYCNTGAFMQKGAPLMVDLNGEWLQVRKIAQGPNGMFYPGESLALYRVGEP